MINQPMAKKAHSSPHERTEINSPDETAHTDPGPDAADTQVELSNWNDAEDRYAMIAEAAYYKAEQRGFELGYEELDWYDAEQELIEQMAREPVY